MYNFNGVFYFDAIIEIIVIVFVVQFIYITNVVFGYLFGTFYAPNFFKTIIIMARVCRATHDINLKEFLKERYKSV